MRFAYAASFLKITQGLSQPEASKLVRALSKFEKAWEGRRFAAGLGMKHLREDFFEFRVDLQKRVIFRRSGDLIVYLLHGSHDEIRKYLASL